MLDTQTTANSSSAGLATRPSPRLGELLETLERVDKSQRDIVVNTKELSLAPSDGALMVHGNERLSLREHGFNQLAAKLQIPATYLRRCDPGLQSRNVNRWLNEQDRDLLLRVEGDEVRAVLSSSYRAINHLDLIRWVESKIGADTPIRYELTNSYLDLQVVGDRETGLSQPRRDTLRRGLHLRNSEVGLSRVSVSALVYRTICLNGLVMGAGRWSYSRRHVGKADIADQVREAFDRAVELSGQAATAFSGTRGIKVSEPEKALERISTRYELAEDEGAAVHRAFHVESGDTLYDVINALTRAGNDRALTLDSRHKLQSLGGRLTDLSATGRWIDN